VPSGPHHHTCNISHGECEPTSPPKTPFLPVGGSKMKTLVGHLDVTCQAWAGAANTAAAGAGSGPGSGGAGADEAPSSGV
jgi:hypothetical protein